MPIFIKEASALLSRQSMETYSSEVHVESGGHNEMFGSVLLEAQHQMLSLHFDNIKTSNGLRIH